jgi:hypothetical protein
VNTRNYGLYAVALAIVVVGALWLGLPLRSLAVLGLVLVCPLMMLVMMRGMHGGATHDQHRAEPTDHTPHDHRALR